MAPRRSWHIRRLYFAKRHISKQGFMLQFAHPWYITNNHWPQMCVVEQQWHGAMLECFYTMEYEAEPLTISLGTKRAPRGVSGTAPRGVAHQGEGSMYCRYWYNKKYAVSSVLFCRPQFVSWLPCCGSTRKWKAVPNRCLSLEYYQV
jgi:hypothetical protein